jgi:hypothetical protein
MVHKKNSLDGVREWIVERMPGLGKYKREVNVPDRMLFQALDNEEDDGDLSPDNDSW